MTPFLLLISFISTSIFRQNRSNCIVESALLNKVNDFDVSIKKMYSAKNRSFYKKFIPLVIGMLCFLTKAETLNAQINSPINNSFLDQLIISSNGQSTRSSSTDSNFNGNGDSKEIAPGETLVLADLEGPGIIKHIWDTSACLYAFGSRYQPLVDDKPAGPILDMVSKGGDLTEYCFGDFKLDQGKHKFKLQGKGASPNRRQSLP